MTTHYIDPISEHWEHDHLDRVQVARFLTKYLDSIYVENNPDLSAGHFVLNLNATWGQGKTFLLHKWAEDLTQKKYPVVTFDAWKNDFSKDPLVGFISELESSLGPWLNHVAPAKALMDTVMKTAKKLIGVTTRVLAGPVVGEIVDGLVDSENLGARVSDTVGQFADRALEEHKETKRLIDEFKINLRDLIEAIEKQQRDDPNCNVNLPLYVFVDELDRCRPTYAIELLENIKHLFGVKGVFFVVATNKEQLCHSIRAIYGESFDSPAYLGRFFDQEYSLPEPDNLRFANHLFAKYKIEDEDRLFTSMEKRPISASNLAEVFAVFSDAFELPLRDQEQTVHRIKAILAVYQHNPVYFDYLVFLLMLRRKSEPLFDTFPDKYLQDRTAYEAELSKKFKGHKLIRIPKVTYHGGTIGASDESLFSLIHLYASITKEDLNTLIKKARNFEDGLLTRMAIYGEAIANQSTPLSLSEYPNLVKQVGQLS